MDKPGRVRTGIDRLIFDPIQFCILPDQFQFSVFVYDSRVGPTVGLVGPTDRLDQVD